MPQDAAGGGALVRQRLLCTWRLHVIRGSEPDARVLRPADSGSNSSQPEIISRRAALGQYFRIADDTSGVPGAGGESGCRKNVVRIAMNRGKMRTIGEQRRRK